MPLHFAALRYEAVASLGALLGGYPPQMLLTERGGNGGARYDDSLAAKSPRGNSLPASRNMFLDAPLSLARGLALLAATAVRHASDPL